MLLIDRAKQIENIIDMVDFNEVYRYFEKQKVAIYQDGFLYFSDIKMQYSINDLLPNEWAIVNYDDLSNDDMFNAGMFIQKMFVNMFYKRHDARIPIDLVALDYPQIYLNFDYMRYERQMLYKAATTADRNIKMNYFRMFINVRDLRKQIIGPSFSKLEYQLETIEGLSQYAMYKAIKTIQKKKADNIFKELTIDFNALSREYFDFRHANMYSGLLICKILEELQINFEELYGNETTIFDFVLTKIKYIAEPIAFKSDKALIANWNKYNEEISERMQIFFENNPKKINGYYQIYGYDPERIFKSKGNVFHESFVILKDLLTNELIYLVGPIVTKILDNSIDIVTTYYQLGGLKHDKRKFK